MKGVNTVKAKIEKIKEKPLINFGVYFLTAWFLLSSPAVIATEEEDQFCQRVEGQFSCQWILRSIF